jgi:two-component system, chemotaxis family, sensor kinase CheA
LSDHSRETGDFVAEFMDDYFAESDEHLTVARRILVDVQPGPAGGLSSSTLEELFRSFHSLKGLAGMVGLKDAELLSHHMESYLRLLRGRGAVVTKSGLNALLKGTHLLEQVIAARRSNQPGPSIASAMADLERYSDPADYAQDAAPSPTEPGTASPRWRAVFTPSPELASRGVNIDHVRTALRAAGSVVHAAPKIATDGSIRFEFVLEGVADETAFEDLAGDGVIVEPLTVEAFASGPPVTDLPDDPRGPLLTSSNFVRVDLGKLDELMRMIGDLVISRARLAESLGPLERRVPSVEWRPVQENSLAIERQLRDLREGVMRVRLVPVGEILGRMPFVVRDLERETGKSIDLQLSGQDTEIDKFLVERMLDPLVHLVRNAVSHGLEPADERVAAGKPATGQLRVGAASVGDAVTLEIEDDGRGIDVDAVARRARAAGMAVPEGPLEGAALLDILCAPGFSTREAADRAAGRGVGMDVVQRAVHELGGTLSVDTEAGQGTRFVIELPLTLAIADAVIATVGGQTFAVPQSSIREVVQISPTAVRALENNEIVPYRGSVIPLLRLASLFGLQARPGRALHAFVVGTGLSAVAIAVDRIQTQREVVVRPMADPLVKVDGVTGATDLGDGRVVLILDLVRLTGRARELTGIPRIATSTPVRRAR